VDVVITEHALFEITRRQIPEEMARTLLGIHNRWWS